MNRDAVLPFMLVLSGILIALLIAAVVYLVCKLWLRPNYVAFKRVRPHDRESLDFGSDSPLSRSSANREGNAAHSNGEENPLFARNDAPDVHSSSNNSEQSLSNSVASAKRRHDEAQAEASSAKQSVATASVGVDRPPSGEPAAKHCACCSLTQRQQSDTSFKKVRSWPHGITLVLADPNPTPAQPVEPAPTPTPAVPPQTARPGTAEVTSCVDIWRLRTLLEQRTSNDNASSGGSFERQESDSCANASVELRDLANWQSASTETHASTLRSFDTDCEMRTLQRELEAQLGRLVSAAVERDDSGYRSIEHANDTTSVSNGSKSSSRSHTLSRLLVDGALLGLDAYSGEDRLCLCTPPAPLEPPDKASERPSSFSAGVPERAMHNRSFRFSKTGLVRRRQFSAKRRHMRPVYETVNDNAAECDSSQLHVSASDAKPTQFDAHAPPPVRRPAAPPLSLRQRAEPVPQAAFCVDRRTLALFCEFSRVDDDAQRPRRATRDDRLMRSARSAFALFQNGTASSCNSEMVDSASSRRSTKSSFESDARSLSGMPPGRHLQTTTSADSADDRDDHDRSRRNVARTRRMHEMHTSFCYSVPSFANQHLLVVDTEHVQESDTQDVTVTFALADDCAPRPRAPSIREIPVIKLTTDEDDTSEL